MGDKMADIYGAVIGDIVGSYHEVLEMEWFTSRTVDFNRREAVLDRATPLFTDKSSFTDDSILTCAVANALLTDGDYEKSIRFFGMKEKDLGVDIYGRSKFGNGFINWLLGKETEKSYGNGCAMRISPVGYAFDTMAETLSEAEKSIICSHGGEDTVACGKAVAGAVFLARQGASKTEIKEFAESVIGRSLDYDIDELRQSYTFKVKAINSVPQAIACFLSGNDFEDVLRKSISIGGDSDTIASISCGIAGAYYDIPDEIKQAANRYITDEYRKILDSFNDRFVNRRYENAEENNCVR